MKTCFVNHIAAPISAMLLLAGACAVVPAFAEDGEQSADMFSPMDTTLLKTFPGTPKFKISGHGNLIGLEGPAGYEHIATGSLSEGYVLCYGGSSAYDVGETESGFGPSIISACTAASNTCTIKRTTLDGRLTLTQVITKPAGNGRNLQIKHTIKNNGASVANLIFRRQADLDVDTGGALGNANFINRHAASERDAVFAWNNAGDFTSEGHSVLLRLLERSPATGSPEAKVTAAILDTTCSPADIAQNAVVTGDFGDTIQVTWPVIGTGASYTTTVEYQRN